MNGGKENGHKARSHERKSTFLERVQEVQQGESIPLDPHLYQIDYPSAATGEPRFERIV